MKNILVIVIAVFSTIFTSYAQDRINECIYSFNFCSEKITNIIGWSYNKNEGQWVDNANNISNRKLSFKPDKRFCTGINSIQIKTFEHNNTINYVLIVEYNGGHYSYPSLELDWNNYVEYQVFSLSEEDYNIITSPNEYQTFTLPCIVYDNWCDKKTDNYIIRKVIDNNNYILTNGFDYILSSSNGLSIKRYKDVIRFNYQVNKYKTLWEYNDRGCKTLEQSYFEISITEWDKLKID